jgi:hypothetical protein
MGCEVGEVWAPAPAHAKLQPYPGSYKESKQDCSGENIGSLTVYKVAQEPISLASPDGSIL